MAKMEKSFGLRMPTEVKEWARHQAEKEDRSINSMIVRILRERMDQDEGASA